MQQIRHSTVRAIIQTELNAQHTPAPLLTDEDKMREKPTNYKLLFKSCARHKPRAESMNNLKIKGIIKRVMLLLCLCAAVQSSKAQVEYCLTNKPILQNDFMVVSVTHVRANEQGFIEIEGVIEPKMYQDEVRLPTSVHLYLYETIYSKEYPKGKAVAVDSCYMDYACAYKADTQDDDEPGIERFPRWERMEEDHKYGFLMSFWSSMEPGIETLRCNLLGEYDYGEADEYATIEIYNPPVDRDLISRLAFPTTSVNIRQNPSKDSPIICTASSQSPLIVDYYKHDLGPYYKAVVLYTGERGYVHKDYIHMDVELPHDSFSLLSELDANSILGSRASVTIHNESRVPIHFSMAGQDCKIKRKKSITFTVPSGPQYMMATGAGHIPLISMETLKAGYEYVWCIYTAEDADY